MVLLSGTVSKTINRLLLFFHFGFGVRGRVVGGRKIDKSAAKQFIKFFVNRTISKTAGALHPIDEIETSFGCKTVAAEGFYRSGNLSGAEKCLEKFPIKFSIKKQLNFILTFFNQFGFFPLFSHRISSHKIVRLN